MFKKIQKILLYLTLYIAMICSLGYLCLRILAIMPFYLDINRFYEGVTQYIEDTYLAEYHYGEEIANSISVDILTKNNYIMNYNVLNEANGAYTLKLQTDKIVSLNKAVKWQYFELDNSGNKVNSNQGHPGFEFIGRIRKNSFRLLRLLFIFKQQEIKLKYSDEKENFKVIFLQPVEEFWPADPRKKKNSIPANKLENINRNTTKIIDNKKIITNNKINEKTK